MNQSVEDSIIDAAAAVESTQPDGAKGSGVAIWYMEGRGFLACLLDESLEMIPGTTIWAYKPTVAEALAEAEKVAERYADRFTARHLGVGS